MTQNDNKNRKKAAIDNFLYHYKIHLIFGICFLLIIGGMTYSIIGNQLEKRKLAQLPAATIDILLFGDYKFGSDLPSLENKVKKTFPAWQTIDLKVEYAPHDSGSYEDIAAMQRSIAVLHTEKPDIYIFDKNQFDKFINDGSFVQLEAHFSNEAKQITYKMEDDEQVHVYGIDITDSHLFEELETEDITKIAVISSKTEKLDKAIEFIQKAMPND